jgi:arabinose-5-phosphate isomerase
MDILEEGKKVFKTEIQALEKICGSLDSSFIDIVQAIYHCKGKLIITGMGKSGHVARKIAATMASLGTTAVFLHPSEALHGDLGIVNSEDVIVAISNSGENDELLNILPNIKMIGSIVITVTGNPDSKMVAYSDLAYIFPRIDEACAMNLAPTSSTTAMLVFGDALAVVLSKLYGFNEENYAIIHPAGSLGKKLLVKVGNIMHKGRANAIVSIKSTLNGAIIEMSSKGLSMVNIVDENMILKGVFTDGDLRRLFKDKPGVYDLLIEDCMTKNPITVDAELLAVDALRLLHDKNITSLPVVEESGKLIGTIRILDIMNAGILL